MSVKIQSVVGSQNLALGSEATPSMARSGGQLIEDYMPQNFNVSKDGLVFVACTAIAGVAHGTSIGTAPPIYVYNPAGSGKELVILYGQMGYISGTLGAGVVAWVGSSTSTVSSGTAIVPVKVNGFAATGSVASVATGPTLSAAPTLLRPAWNVSAQLASTAGSAWRVEDKCNGEFILQEGCGIGLQGVATAGTSPLVVFSIGWIERTK